MTLQGPCCNTIVISNSGPSNEHGRTYTAGPLSPGTSSSPIYSRTVQWPCTSGSRSPASSPNLGYAQLPVRASVIYHVQQGCVLTPCNDDPNHSVCPACDAEHSEVADMGVIRNYKKQAVALVSQTQNFARRRADVHIAKPADCAHVRHEQTAALRPVGHVGIQAEEDGCGRIRGHGQQLREGVRCKEKMSVRRWDRAGHSLYPNVAIMVGKNADIDARAQLAPK